MGKKKKKKKKAKSVENTGFGNVKVIDVSQLRNKRYYALISGVPVEDGAILQMENAMSLPVSVAGALMPDAHQGYGLPIGGVLATQDVVIPYAVGMDIGCRMALTLYQTEIDPEIFINKNLDRLKKILVENTRFGQSHFNGEAYDPVLEREEFYEIPFLKKHHKTAIKQFGTSGQGNHFVEFGEVDILTDDNDLGIPKGRYLGLLSHSGSRHFGYEIAKHYSNLAQKKLKLPQGLEKLAWLELDSPEGEEYWKAMQLAGDYAKANHDHIHKRIAQKLGMKPVAKVENHHNFAWKEIWNGKEVIIHRKGATPAQKGVLGIIPGSMTTPAYIVRGRGFEKTLNSASHGAGRVMSRRKALKTFTWKDLQEELKRAKVELIGGGLDEVPMAYKNINDVINLQSDIIDIIGRFQPRIVRMDS